VINRRTDECDKKLGGHPAWSLNMHQDLSPSPTGFTMLGQDIQRTHSPQNQQVMSQVLYRLTAL